MTLLDDLSRPVKIHCCQDRTITYRQKGEPVFNGVALPVFSVDTIEEAEELQVMACQRVPGGHPLMPDKPWYKIYMGLGIFELELDHLPTVTEKLRSCYDRLKEIRGENN